MRSFNSHTIFTHRCSQLVHRVYGTVCIVYNMLCTPKVEDTHFKAYSFFPLVGRFFGCVVFNIYFVLLCFVFLSHFVFNFFLLVNFLFLSVCSPVYLPQNGIVHQFAHSGFLLTFNWIDWIQHWSRSYFCFDHAHCLHTEWEYLIIVILKYKW